MALQHSGLKTKFALFRQNLEKLTTAMDGGNDLMPQVAANLSSIVEQVQGVHEDVQFMATTLGNSSTASETGEKHAITADDVGDAASHIISLSPPRQR